MKLTFLTGALALSLFASSGALGADKATEAKSSGVDSLPKKVKSSAPQKHQEVALTGSYIKRDIHRKGIITDGPNLVYVLDGKTMEISGGADLSQVLLHSGFRH
jgi:hypothetical protein